MSSPMQTIALVLGFAVAAPALATAAPAAPAAVKPISTAVSFELIDRGTAVEVIAHNVKAARTGIQTTRSRLEVPVVGFPRALPRSAKDKTIISTELSGGASNRVFSVKTVFDRADVRELARFAQAIQVGNDLHVIIPRSVPAAGSAIALPEPTLSPELAARVAAASSRALGSAPDKPPAPAAIGPVITPEEIAHAASKSAVAATAAAHEPAPVTPVAAIAAVAGVAPTAPAPADSAHAAPAPVPPHADAKHAEAEAKPAKLTGAKESGGNGTLMVYGMAALALIGAGTWVMKKQQAQQAPGNQIDVIAQRVLGPKAKIVWLSAGSREMIIAVTAQQVRMLGSWKKGEAPPSSLPEAHMLADGKHARDARTSRPIARVADAISPASPAIAGLLKLRGKQTEHLVSDDVATGELEADAAWAKEIMNATTSFRR